MSWTGKALRLACSILVDMPDDIYFDVDMCSNLQFQAYTQEKVKNIRSRFPGVVWKRTWNKTSKWWEYDTVYNGLSVQIYAVKENPEQCKAITEKRVVTKKVATAWKEKEVEQEVIVGWDCNGGAEKEETNVNEGS